MEMHRYLKIPLSTLLFLSTISLQAQTHTLITRFETFGARELRVAPGEQVRLIFLAEALAAGVLELDIEGLAPLTPLAWDSRQIVCDTGCTVTDTLVIEPTKEQCGEYTFNVVAKFRGADGSDKAWSRIHLTVVPQLRAEPPFSKGSSNTLCWPECDALIHELIHFPIFKSKPAQLALASAPENVTCDVVEQLTSGLKYGYFVRTTIADGQRLKTLASDTVFSVQDASQPTAAQVERFTVDGAGKVALHWPHAHDDVSRIEKYVILRKARDTAADFQLVDTLHVFPVARISPANYFPVEAKKDETLYTDGTGRIRYLPQMLSGTALLKTSRKDIYDHRDTFLRFNLTVPSRIYIAMDPRIDHPPFWVDALFDFVPIKQVKLDLPGGPTGLMLFASKDVFPAGEVVFGGNWAEGAIFRDFADLMYVVFIKPETAALPFASDAGVVFVDSLGPANDLKAFSYKLQTFDAAGNFSDGPESGPVILDLRGRCRPIVSRWFDFENDLQQRFDGGTDRRVTVQDPQTVAACAGFRATDSLRFQAVRENIQLFSDARPEDRGIHFFDSGWIDVADLPQPFTYDFDFLPQGKDANFVNGKRYFCRVQSKDVHGNLSAWSDTVAAVQDVFPPQDISNLTAENEAFPASGDGCIRLRWQPAVDPVSGVQHYVIYRSADGGSSFSAVDTISGVQPTYCDTLSKLSGNRVFHYRVAGVDGVGNAFDFRQSAWEVAIRALKGPVILGDPNAVISCGNGTLGVTNDTLLVLWPDFDNTGVGSYEIQIADPGGNITLKNQSDGAAAGAFCPLTAGDGVYEIRVRAHYTNGDVTLFSNTLTIRKKEVLAGVAPLQAQQAADGSGDILLSWQHGDGDELTAFRIFMWREGETQPDLPAMTVPGDSFQARFMFDSGSLTAYQCTFFSVQAADCFGLLSRENPPVVQYANPPPVFDTAQTVVADDFVTVCWQRPEPRAPGSQNFEVLVRVFEDSITAVPLDTARFINKTCFTFRQPQPGHNYIFKVRETILGAGGQSCSEVLQSAESRFFVVPFENLPPAVTFDVQPLPAPPGATTGSVFVAWQDSSASIEIFRVKWTSDGVNVIADSVDVIGADTLLVQNLDIARAYVFSLISIDSLGQRSEMNVTRQVSFAPPWQFTPTIVSLNPDCFRDTLSVVWGWLDNTMQRANQTFGAEQVTVEFSVDANFLFRKGSRSLPAGGRLTLTSDDIPFINEQNNVLYLRMRAVDRWGHLSPWSTDYAELGSVMARFDNLPPAAVTVAIDSVRAPLLSGAGKVNVHLSWPDVSDDCSGVAFYEIARNDSVIARDSSRTRTHRFIDRNLAAGTELLNFRWAVHGVDSVGNRQAVAAESRIPLTLSPPDSVWCMNDTTVCWRPAADNLPNLEFEYFVEGARFAELLGNPLTNIFAGPLDTLCLNFNVPWKTVFWRVKVRVDNLESAWSDTFFCDFSTSQNMIALQSASQSDRIPEEFALRQNYPNPFNPSTTIEFAVKKSATEGAHVVLEIFNISGQRIRTLVNETRMPGNYSVVWHGRDDAGRGVSSGLYVYRMQVSGVVITRKMLFLK